MSIFFHDKVEDLHRLLFDGEQKYREYLNAVWNEQAIEGSLVIDDVMAAIMIRQRASDLYPADEIANANLDTIVRSLRVVLRRYGMSRAERRSAHHDFEVTPNGVVKKP